MKPTNKANDLVMAKVQVVADRYQIDQYTIQLYKEVFMMVDFANASKMGEMRWNLVLHWQEIQYH